MSKIINQYISQYSTSDERLPDGRPFTRIFVSPGMIVPLAIAAKIKRNPHPFIAEVYHVGIDHYDVEVTTRKDCRAGEREEEEKAVWKERGRAVKDHFQSLGIFVMTWWNVVFGFASDGKRKFDLEDLIEATYLGYPYDLTSNTRAVEAGCTTLKEVDDFSFDHDYDGS